MRLIVTILLAMTLSGWIASRIELPSAQSASAVSHNDWVRTIDGWERRSDFFEDRNLHAPPVHPLVIASLQLMFSVSALLWYERKAAR